MPTPDWFSFQDDAPAGPHWDYVMAARTAAQLWTSSELGLTPDATRAYDLEPGYILEVDVPGLTCGPRFLRVLHTQDDPDEPLLQGAWLGSDFCFGGATDPEDANALIVTGVAASPKQCGEWAAFWMESQLRRPVSRREWDRPAAGPTRLLPSASPTIAAMEWWWTDVPSGFLDASQTTPWWWWLMRRPPAREIEERPDRATRRSPFGQES